MTPQEQRIAIAEWCGWKFVPSHDVLEIALPEYWDRHDERAYDIDELPDYCNDLNAMWQAEKHLKDECLSKWIRHDALMANRWHAPASERAEALCRTLWPERWKK